MGKSISDLLGTAATPFTAHPPSTASTPAETKAVPEAPAAAAGTVTTTADKTADKPVDAKTPTEPKTDAKTTTSAGAAKDKAPGTPTDKPTESKPAFDWESVDNPYRKRYEDTRNWATQINQRFVEQGRQLEILNKKLDGTYDPATDDAPAAEQSVARQTQQAATIQKVKTSNAVAEQLYGKDTIEKLIWADTAPFRAFDDNPAVQARILASEAPVLEAVQFLKEVDFFTTYGKDTEAIKTAIRAEYETELRATVDQLVEERLKERLAKRDAAPSSLSTVPASDAPAGGNGAPGPTPLHQLGNPGFATFRR